MRQILLFLLLPVAAQAGTLLWTLQGVTFSDGGTASGSFLFDASTGAYSAISITTTAASVFAGATYTFPDPGNAALNGPAELFAVTSNAPDLNLTPFLGLIWGSNLTGAGGTVPFSSVLNSGESRCTNATCSTIDQTFGRTITAGSVVAATNAPEPATSLLIGCGLATLVMRRRLFGGAPRE